MLTQKRSPFVSKKCQVTGKKPCMGNSYSRRGIAKKKKGIGLKITGIKRRRFQPNLAKKRFWFPDENRFITLRLCAGAMRNIDKLGISTVVREMRSQGQKI